MRTGLVGCAAGLAGIAVAFWSTSPARLDGTMHFTHSYADLISDARAMCGPTSDAAVKAADPMTVDVNVYEGHAVGRRFHITQEQHQICPAAGCPTRIFITHPDGSRGILVNTLQPLLDRSSAKTALPRLDDSGRQLAWGGRVFDLSW